VLEVDPSVRPPLPWILAVLKVVAPVTPRLPPRVVAPVPTLRVLLPVILTLPLCVVAPVTVRAPPIVPLPPILKLALAWAVVVFLMKSLPVVGS
jgi:hypothetical protein